MFLSDDVGTFTPVGPADFVLSGSQPRDPSAQIVMGQMLRPDQTDSYFADMLESWWWCLQSITSVGCAHAHTPHNRQHMTAHDST